MSVEQLSAAGSLVEVPLPLPRAKGYVHGKVKVSARGFVAYSLEDLEAFALTFCPSLIGDTFLDTLLSTSSWTVYFMPGFRKGVAGSRGLNGGRKTVGVLTRALYTAGFVFF